MSIYHVTRSISFILPEKLRGTNSDSTKLIALGKIASAKYLSTSSIFKDEDCFFTMALVANEIDANEWI